MLVNNEDSHVNNSLLIAQHMPRQRINDLFDQATKCKLVYIISGSGYGKTQATNHYVKQQTNAVIRWLQLDENDNVASGFWEQLTRDISIDNPQLALKLRELGFPETHSRFKQFTGIVKNTEHASNKRFLIFDDFHLIHSKVILTFIERCVNLQIPGLCIIIISRKEPVLNAVSLFAKGRASIIVEDDLRFTEDEIAAFLEFRNIPFIKKNISEFYKATKGWALAIQLLSLILKRTPDSLDTALDAMKQNVFKLFEAEAWGDFPENIKKALVQLALVPDFPLVPLRMNSEEMAFIMNSSQLISFIWRDNLIGDYRIHPLYLEFLHNKINILTQDERINTYLQAALWCNENDLHLVAMRYFAKSHQYKNMLDVLFSYPFKLPPDTCEYFFTIIEELDFTKENRLDSCFLLLKNFFIPILLAGMGKYEEAIMRSFKTIREWEKSDTDFAINLLYASYSNLAYIDMYTCVYTHKYESPKYLKKSVEYFKMSSIPPVKTSGAFTIADVRAFSCLVGVGADLQEFDQFLEAARQTAFYIEETYHDMYYGYDDLVACEIAFYKNQLDIAKKYAYKSVLKAREKKQYSIEAMAEHHLLRISLCEGDYLLTKKALKQLRSHLDNPIFWSRQLLYDLTLGYFYAQVGLPELSVPWLVSDDKEESSEIQSLVGELIVSVKNYIAFKKYDQALAILINSYPRQPQNRFLFGELILTLLTAFVRIKTNDVTGAMEDFEQAFKLSYSGVFEMPFIELGKNLKPLTDAALKQESCTIPNDWLKKITRKASVYSKKVTVIKDSYKADKKMSKKIQLSERELEILTDLYHGLTREEMAENRYLSLPTVNKLIESIFLKLDARNNVDAIRIAIKNKLIIE